MNHLVKIAARGLSSELFAVATCSSAIKAVFGRVPVDRSWAREHTVTTPEGINALWSRVLRFENNADAAGFDIAKLPNPIDVEQHVFWHGPEAVRVISELSIKGCDAVIDVDFKDDDIVVRWGVESQNGGPASLKPEVVDRWISTRVRRFESFMVSDGCMRGV